MAESDKWKKLTAILVIATHNLLQCRVASKISTSLQSFLQHLFDDSKITHIVHALMSTTSTLTTIEDLKAQIATLEKNALQELMEKRNTLSHEIAAVDAEIAKLRPVEGKKTRAVVAKATGKSPSLQELKEILATAPGKTIGIRSEGYDLRNIKVLAAANPALLQVGGKGAWPTVTLLK